MTTSHFLSLIEKLESVAREHKWEDCIKQAAEILDFFSRDECFSIAAHYVSDYYAVFHLQHPSITVPGDIIIEIRNKLSNNQDATVMFTDDPQFDFEFNTPGSNSFISALEELWKNVGSANILGYNVISANIIAEIMMAKLTHVWGMTYPEKWNAWYISALSGQVTNPGIIDDVNMLNMQVSEWLSVANKLKDYGSGDKLTDGAR
jgi:hypothetical protein